MTTTTTPGGTATAAPTPTRRLDGVDVARALAIIGMVTVHFGPYPVEETGVGAWIYASFEGKASLLFVLVAGVGVSLLARRREVGDVRARLLYRTVWLFPLGLALQALDHPVAVILQYYALYFALVAPFVGRRDRTLLTWALAIVPVGAVVVAWTYVASPEWVVPLGGHSPGTVLSDVVVFGYYPAITWTAPMLFGMWVGRRDLATPRVRGWLVVGGISALVLTTLIGELVPSSLGVAAEPESWWVLLTTEPHSQMPLWLIGGTGFAAAVLGVSLLVADRLPRASGPIADMGRLALSVYVAHLVIFHVTEDLFVARTVAEGARTVLAFTAVSVAAAWLWLRMFRRGPLESIVRAGWGGVQRVRRRGGATLLVVAVVLAGCTSDAPSSAPSPAPSADEDGAASASGGEAVRPTATSTPAVGGTMVVWARGDLPAAYAAHVATLPDVVAVAHVRSDTLGIVGWRDPQRGVERVLDDGFRVPADVAAIEPGTYAATLSDPSVRDVVSELRPGQVLLAETGAELRGIGAGGTVDLVGRPGLEVAAVAPDDALGRSELVVHIEDAAAVGLPEDGTVFVRHDATDGSRRLALEDALATAVPAQVTARVVDVRDDEQRRRAPLVLSLLQVKARFGEFAYRPIAGQREVTLEPGWVEQHIVDAQVPLLGTVRCHRDTIEDLRGALAEIERAGLGAQIDPDRYAGCFVPRRISTSGERLSRHSWGIAVDVNVDLSQPGGGTPPSPEVIGAFSQHGFRWGGHFIVPDHHHFEWVGEDLRTELDLD